MPLVPKLLPFPTRDHVCVVDRALDVSGWRRHSVDAMQQLSQALHDRPEREPHSRAAFLRGWQNTDVTFLQGLSRAAVMVISSSVGGLLMHVSVPPDSDQ